MTSPTDRRTTERTLWCDIPASPSEREKVQAAIQSNGISGLVWKLDRLVAALDEGAFDAALQAGDGQAIGAALLLMVEDVRWACDALDPSAKGLTAADGIVSVPLLRGSSDESWVHAAERLSSEIDRPNIAFSLIANGDGFDGLVDLIAAGYRTDLVGVVTRDQLLRADEAYVEGLARRLREDLRLSSVSSTLEMPIATMDDAVNARLDAFADEEDPIPPDESEIDKPWPGEARVLRGEVIVAYAKLCYAEHQERIKSGESGRLIGLGAHPQRVRFAELSNTDPPVVYATELSGPGVIFTADLNNLDSIANIESKGVRADGIDEARQTLARLADIHQDLEGALQEAFRKIIAREQAWGSVVEAVERRLKR